MPDQEDTSKLEAALARLQEERVVAAQKHTQALAEHHRRFHPVWGQLLKAGYVQRAVSSDWKQRSAKKNQKNVSLS